MIEEALVTTLRACWPGIVVYPVQVPENQTPPFICFREIDIDDDDSVGIEIDACAASGLEPEHYRQSKQLAEAIRLALRDGFTYTGGCVTRVDANKRQDLVDRVDPMYWTRAQYTLKLDNDPY